MNGPQWPEARPGQEITADLWSLARAANRANRWRPGDGMLFTETSDGIVVSAKRRALLWNHPFRVTVSGGSATVLVGTINTLVPLIDETPLDEDPAPVLRWDELWTDEDGRGYIALDFQCDENWKIIPETLEVLQVADWLTEDGGPSDDPSAMAYSGSVPGLSDRRARWPLAMLRDRGGRVDLYQITMAGIQHKAVPSFDGKRAQHFFW